MKNEYSNILVKIEERRKEAKNKKIAEKLTEIVSILGDYSGDGDFYYRDGYLDVQEEDGFYTVKHKDEVVFKCSPDQIILYVPGAWEDCVNTLYKVDCPKRKQKEAENEYKKLIEQLKNEWKL